MSTMPFCPIPWALTLCLLGADASAQTSPVYAGAAERISQSSVRHAGTYHIVSGTWTRGGAQSAAVGPDVIYCNTAGSGYFGSIGGPSGLNPGSENVDAGIIPVRGNPEFPLADRASYTVNCFEIGYCDLGAAGTSGWEINFYESYDPCTPPPATATASISSTGLPANGCWIIAIDLSGGQEFELLGEGGAGPGTAVDPHFGWSFRHIGTGTAAAGLLLAGDPDNTNPPGFPNGGAGTYYGPPSLCGSGSTGLGAEDQWFTAGTLNQCFFFGGYSNSNMCGLTSTPFSSWHMEMYAEPGQGNLPVGNPYCMANPNSTGVASTLALTGNSSATGNNVLLQAALPPSSFGLFLTSLTQDFIPNAMGSAGNLCLGGTIGFFSSPGQVRNSGPDGVLLLDTQLSAWDLAAIPDGMTTYAAAAGLSTNFQCWHRDVVNGAASSNFTNAVSVNWTP